MIAKEDLFKNICGICVICLIFLITVPLVTFAISTTQIIPVNQVVSSEKKKIISNITSVMFNKDLSLPEEYISTRNLPEYDPFTYAQRQEQNLPTVLTTPELYYGKKVIYLTFDDGPDGKNTPIVLDILKKNNIKATFFVIGTAVEKNPETLKRIYNEGHSIGNHSYNHIYRELYQSSNAYLDQLHHTDELIENVLNVRPHISRAPGGSAGNFTKLYWDTLKRQGYLEVGWNISSGDASHATAQQILNNIISQTEKNDFLWSHAILLMHDAAGHGETIKALPDIIKYFTEHGFEFRVINSKTPPAW